jgi:hypothetical protein
MAEGPAFPTDVWFRYVLLNHKSFVSNGDFFGGIGGVKVQCNHWQDFCGVVGSGGGKPFHFDDTLDKE